ncbi:uncharacterized protein EV422DRAFT_535255 [Fimicolochytrium jonesii]|uniref:uncharacterized protein n=1 Tax=Fimicolochytrium jonesii TaxID=1396493 RepID=UPI0022FEBB82|nr:uncharacterized protein EV422DRAFT_535255 [Fimicolochytrium jonesii]KAI8819146.1 hypothetical protein EV422DRAFT_535255 [Fimicolochytrium jonesii]
MSATNAIALPSATRRLLRDLAEINASPVDANITAAPLEDNIYEWHVNLRSTVVSTDDGSDADGIMSLTLHLVLVFPKQYPLDPPSVTLCTPVPHANVVQSLGGYRICLDMLDVNKNNPYEGWSRSYTVASLLRQLQAFIFDTALMYSTDHGTIGDAVRTARMFECTRCGHGQGNGKRAVWPAFPTKEEMSKVTKLVVRRAPVSRRPRIVSSAHSTPASENQQEEDEWTVVQSRRAKRVGMAEKVYGSPKTLVKASGTGFVAKARGVQAPKPTYAGVSSWAVLAAAAEKTQLPKQIHKASPGTLVIREKKRADPIAPPPQSLTELRQLVVSTPSTARPASVTSLANQEAEHAVCFPSSDPLSAGLFATLPYELLFRIVTQCGLTGNDVLSLSATCRHMHLVCEDGRVWRDLFSLYAGRSRYASVTAATMADWKSAFAMEVNCVADGMRCFASKLTWEEDILGLPITYTVNPKTKCVDYIACEVEMLSRSAFHEDKVRKSVWNTDFSEWCPVYLTHEHFTRALPDIQAFLIKMSPERGTRVFDATMALDVLPKMMNTLIVQLCDHGVAASARAIEGYFLLHRLLAALIERYPSLQKRIDSRIDAFVNSEAARMKSATPSLGNLLPVLPFSSRHRWAAPRVANAFLSESADRAVLWVCHKYPELAETTEGSGSVKPDMALLKKVWDAQVVSKRLMMFHVCFLSYFDTDSKASGFLDASDQFYGRPPKKIVDLFQSHTKNILAVSTWPAYYAIMQQQCPSPGQLTAAWSQSIRNSLRKKYHTRGMDFTKIHKSGVSKILLKGQSYSAPPDVRKVFMKETWRYAEDLRFLDATCSAFDFEGKHLVNLDFSRPTALSGAIKHSGDIVDHRLRHGTHTITVNIRLLPPTVRALVFCMSAYAGSTLADIKSPTVRLETPVVEGNKTSTTETTELCSYNFKSSPEELGDRTNIIMCVLWRRATEARWEVKAVGELGYGKVPDYNRMLPDLRRVVAGLA